MRSVRVRKGAYMARIMLPTADGEHFEVRGMKKNASGHSESVPKTEIAQQFPELKDVLALHGSDRRGKPRFVFEQAMEYISSRQLVKAAQFLRVRPSAIADVDVDRRSVLALCRSCERWWKVEADAVFDKYAAMLPA